ncbi:hypothetical protein BsWGS_16960 [Bradybaena similaris]
MPLCSSWSGNNSRLVSRIEALLVDVSQVLACEVWPSLEPELKKLMGSRVGREWRFSVDVYSGADWG